MYRDLLFLMCMSISNLTIPESEYAWICWGVPEWLQICLDMCDIVDMTHYAQNITGLN